jgi:FkbM family methyltransferase
MTARKRLLNLANGLLAPAGVQLYRRGIDMESALRRIALSAHGINSVLDLGAARGDWSRMALALFPTARVVGVDPLDEREPYLAKLRAAESRYDFVLAVAGKEDGGTVELAVTPDLDGSTVHGHEGVTRTVPVRSVDSIVRMKGLDGPFLLKFDTHGFEKPILDSAEQTLLDTRYIVMEAYNFRHSPDTMLFHEMIAWLEPRGFRVCNLVDVLNRPTDGVLWQIDLFFARHDDPIFASDSFRHG